MKPVCACGLAACTSRWHQALVDYGVVDIDEIPERMSTVVALPDGTEFHARRQTLEERSLALMGKIRRYHNTERNKLPV